MNAMRLHRFALLLGLISVAPSAWAAKAERVITLAPHLTELVCAAAGCEALVAVSAYSDYPPPVRALPVVGDAAQLNLEAVLALRPTRIITWQGGTSAGQLARLKTVGLPVTALRIAKLGDVADAIEQLGQLLHSAPRAQAAAADFRQRLAELRKNAEHAAPVRVLYQIESTPVYSINRDSPISEAITLCGGINVFADLPTLAAPVTDEAVLAARAQVVIHGPEDAAGVQAYWQRFGRAARLKPQLVAIDPDLLARSGPRLVQGVEQVCAALAGVRATARP